MKTYRSYYSEETKRFSEGLAKKLTKSKGQRKKRNRAHALVFALSGELGSGKTTFTQGFLRGLGVKRRTASPTFILFRRFALRNSPFANFYHIDAYRIKKTRELAALEFNEILADPQNIVFVEWADKIKNILPKSIMEIQFRHGRKENERTIKIK